MDSKTFPDTAFNSNLELARNDSYTKASATFKSGPKAKVTSDKTHELKLDLAVSHKLTADSADVRYGLQVLYPVQVSFSLLSRSTVMFIPSFIIFFLAQFFFFFSICLLPIWDGLLYGI